MSGESAENMAPSAFHPTKSLCPVCLAVVEANVVERDGKVFLDKCCPEHGSSSTYLWPEAAHYQWMVDFDLSSAQPSAVRESSLECPRACGLCSQHVRKSTLVEIEITQRCNLRCPVCFVSAGEAPPDPSMETLHSMFEAALIQTSGDTSIQLTGGEPTVREELPEIIAMGCAMGFDAIEINTNGLRIAMEEGYIERLRDAGASGVYMQFDGLSDDVYETIRGQALVDVKLAALERCREAGVQVVLAMAVILGVNDDQVGAVLDFALSNNDIVVGVALQPAFTSGRFEPEEVSPIGLGDVAFMLEEQTNGLIGAYDLWPLSTSHPLCSAATVLMPDGDTFVPVTRMFSPEEYHAEYDPTSPQGSVFFDLMLKRELSAEGALSVVIMNYMDVTNFDLLRIRECSMTVVMEDGRLVPFCSYQLTDCSGNRLHPTWARGVTIDPVAYEIAFTCKECI